jgi:hypothetical protein
MTTAIAKQIREAIDDSAFGRGPAVTGTDANTCTHRIIDVRVKKGVVQGKALNTGKWFNLAACSAV